MLIPDIGYFRNLANITDPQFPRRLADALDTIQKQSAITEQQGNLSPHGQPDPPPNIQSVTATGANGWLHVSIQDQSPGLSRGVQYFVEHSAFPDFRDAQIRPMGTSRQIDLPIGNATRYVRAYSAYPSSPASEHVYHGSPTAPLPVHGGGAVGPPAWLPSQGSGTDAPGVSGVGFGRLPKRTAESGVIWKGQRVGGPAGLLSTGMPVNPSGSGLSPAGGGGGGGGGSPSVTEAIIAACETLTMIAGTGDAITGVTATPYSARVAGQWLRYIPIHANTTAVTINENSIGAVAVTDNGANALVGGEFVIGKIYILGWDGTRYQIVGVLAPISAVVLASDAHGVPIAAVLATGKIWIGSAGNLPVAQTPSGDISMTAAGVVTVTQVNGAAIPLSAALVGTNASRQIIAASAFTSSSFTPVIKVGGATTSITFTSTATSVITGSGTGAPVIVVINVTITGWPAVPVGTVTVEGLPVNALAQAVGNFAAISGFVGLSAGVSIIPVLSGAAVTLDTQGATGVVALGAATIANGSVFTIAVAYQSA